MRSGWEGRVRLDLQGKVSSYTIDGNWRIVWYTNQDIGQVTICSKTIWHLCGKLIVLSCVAELCSKTVWQNSTSVAELCGGSYYRRVCGVRGSQPASNLLLSRMPFLLFLFFFSFFLLFPLFCLWRLYQVFSGVILRPPLPYLVFFGCPDIAFVFVLTSSLSLPWHCVCLCLNIAFVIVIAQARVISVVPQQVWGDRVSRWSYLLPGSQ